MNRNFSLGEPPLAPEPLENIQRRANRRFANYLRKRRQRQGLTQLDLSIMLRRGPKYIWRLENCYADVDIYEFVEIVQTLEDEPDVVIKGLL